MNQGHLFDTNILIYHVNGRLDPPADELIFRLLEGPVYISVISRIEVLGWGGHSEDSRQASDSLLSTLTELSLDETIIQTTIRLRRESAVKLPDVIIAASALSYDLPLITRNTNDFEKVSGLRLINPFQPSGH